MLRGFSMDINAIPAYFYCSRNPAEPGRSNPEAILASIVRQLSSIGPGQAILPPVVDIYKEREAEGFASGPLSTSDSVHIIELLSEYYPVMIIIVDAVDECDFEKRASLLEALESILQNSFGMVKIFVSSRDDHDIVCHLEIYPNLRIASEKNKEDIKSFVEAETEVLISKRKLLRYSSAITQLKTAIKKKVCLGAEGMYE
jgi:hypothetical protein